MPFDSVTTGGRSEAKKKVSHRDVRGTEKKRREELILLCDFLCVSVPLCFFWVRQCPGPRASVAIFPRHLSPSSFPSCPISERIYCRSKAARSALERGLLSETENTQAARKAALMANRAGYL